LNRGIKEWIGILKGDKGIKNNLNNNEEGI